jgi:hypothetical protein
MTLAARSSLLLLVATLSSGAGAHSAHVHGLVGMSIAVDDDEVSVQIEAPLDSLVGFEHAPRTEAQKRAVQAMLDRFSKADTLLAFDPKAQCSLIDSQVESTAEASGDADAGHADLDATLRFRCADVTQLRTLDVAGLMSAFARISRVEAEIASGQGQYKSSVQRPQTRLRWGK